MSCGTLGFDEKSFFIKCLGFTTYWDYKPTNIIHADSSGANSSEKNVDQGAINKIHLKCDVIDGSVLKRVGQPILYNFVLDKALGYNVFCQTETIHCKGMKKAVWNTETF